MKLKFILLNLLMLLTLLVRANAESFDLVYETLSSESLFRSSKYKSLGSVDPGHHKTIIKIPKLPEAKSYILRWKRPLLSEQDDQQEYSKESLIFNGKCLLGEEIPALLLISRGFLPGEKISLTLETKDGKSISQAIDFFPQPVIKEMGSGQPKLKAKLALLSPTAYQILIEGFQLFEKLRVRAVSSEETKDYELSYTQESCIELTFGMLGKQGGVCDLSVTRQNGDQLCISLPWGEELIEHLRGVKSSIVLDFAPITNRAELLK